MSTNMTLIRATNAVSELAGVYATAGKDTGRLAELEVELRKLAETAELRDELWDAARAVHVAEIAWVSGLRRMKRDLYNALISARLRLNTAITVAMAADTDGLNAGS